ncbi:hypothetical protein BH23CHL5_BH23CHL5_13670 [soil metagenome]
MVIDLSGMNAVRVDLEAKTAVVQGGAKWKDVDEATTAHGLVTTGGVISTTGVGGLALGGGIGTILRLNGLACDNLLSAEVVLASGEVVWPTRYLILICSGHSRAAVVILAS